MFFVAPTINKKVYKKVSQLDPYKKENKKRR